MNGDREGELFPSLKQSEKFEQHPKNATVFLKFPFFRYYLTLLTRFKTTELKKLEILAFYFYSKMMYKNKTFLFL